ncbi:MAG: tail fiber domain-containing protein [Myxococcota bacterium]|nr:tail fiber domain-containing protein [Myxococcota bacterium]
MSQLMCTPEPQQCVEPEARETTRQQSQSQNTAAPKSNSQRQEELSSSSGKNVPSAKLDLSNIPVINTIIPSPGATINASLSLGGSITAKPAGSKNPLSVSNKGISASGDKGSTSLGYDGSVSTELTSTLNGIKNSVGINLNNGQPTVSFGSAGKFGATQTSIKGNTISFTCTSQDIKRTVNGVELSGNISYTLDVTVTPHPPAPWYERVFNTVADGLQSIGDALWANKEVILVGVVTVGVAAAIISTGGAAAPALALTSDRRKKKNITFLGLSPSGIPKYTFQYIDDEQLYHGVMAQDLTKTHPKALRIGEGGFYKVDYTLLDVPFYKMPTLS